MLDIGAGIYFTLIIIALVFVICGSLPALTHTGDKPDKEQENKIYQDIVNRNKSR